MTGTCPVGLGGHANPAAIAIPPDLAFVGLTLAAQGFTFGGGPCLGQIALSDTIDPTVQ